MKNLQKKQKVLKSQQQQPLQQESYEEPQKQKNLHFFNKLIKNDSLFVTFSGTIEWGVVQNCQQLILSYSIATGPDWKVVSGKQSGISQIAGTNGDKIVWNLPFQVSYETTYLSGWPQLIVVLYGTDFFGRSFVQAYGNVHLPTGQNIQSRKMRLFKPLPQSIISGIFGYLNGTIAQYKQPAKVLSLGEGRQVTRVCTQGELSIKVQTTKHNFKRFGYE